MYSRPVLTYFLPACFKLKLIVENNKLKIIALTNATTFQRLNDSLSADDIVLVGLTKTSDVISLVSQEKCDFFLVDSLFDEADYACTSLGELDVAPVGLLIHEDETNWKQLRSWDVDGFLPQEAGTVELTARIKAILRRSCKTLQKRENPAL
jgi:DNA-binding response OmpR family regulator